MTLPPALAGYAHQVVEFAALAVGFFILSLVVKGARALADARAAAADTRLNLTLYVMDFLTVGPAMAFATGALYAALHAPGAVYAGEVIWNGLGPIPTFVAAVFFCDFFAYCNHRLLHTSWLWPAHAIHHSDRHLTWLSLLRMHPFDRVSALLDILGIIALGLPDWAVIGAIMVRHYYGHLIHADLPWTLGKFDLIFISPAMHRWHHALEYRGQGVNFATVFSVFDRAFGTFYAPGPCDVPTGVHDEIAPGLIGAYLHPARVWAARLKAEPMSPEVSPTP